MAIRGLHPGLERTAGIGLKMFSNDELEKIHLATLDVLWNVGVKVESRKAIQIFPLPVTPSVPWCMPRKPAIF